MAKRKFQDPDYYKSDSDDEPKPKATMRKSRKNSPELAIEEQMPKEEPNALKIQKIKIYLIKHFLINQPQTDEAFMDNEKRKWNGQKYKGLDKLLSL